MRSIVLAALLASAAAPALAAADLTKTSDGYTYFNRPGADLATHNADVGECRLLAGRLHQPLPAQPGTAVATTGSPVAAGVGAAIGMAIAQAIQQSMADHKGRPVVVEDCMVVKGWRVVAIGDDEGKAVAALDPKSRAARLAAWIGAAEPHGAIVRVFANDAARDGSALMFAPATHVGVALSEDLAPKTPAGPLMEKAAYLPPPAGPNGR